MAYINIATTMVVLIIRGRKGWGRLKVWGCSRMRGWNAHSFTLPVGKCAVTYCFNMLMAGT